MPKIAIFDTKNINWTHKIFVSHWPEFFLQHRMCFFQDSGQLGSNYVGQKKLELPFWMTPVGFSLHSEIN